MNRLAKLCPSLMCADFTNLSEEIKALEDAGADLFHIDVMDGHFVPNFALGIEDVKAVRKLAHIPYDVHLMVKEPDPYIETFAALGCEIIYVHVEASTHLHRTLTNIKKAGKQAGVAVNPGTPLAALEEVLPLADVVLVMSVNPGYAGQAFIDNTFDKIRRLEAMIREKGLHARIAIDGAISPQVVQELSACTDYFVLGTAGLFRKDKSYGECMLELRKMSKPIGI